MNAPHIQWLGRVDFDEAVILQERAVADLLAGVSGERVLLLEHDPVYTIGRTRDRSSLGQSDFFPHPVREINRGGQATYHGPGQLVGYPILDLRRRGKDLHRYLRFLEDTLIALLREDLGIPAIRREGLTGTWVGERKIASIGVGVRQWISMHGFGLNVSADLDGYSAITPCGIAGIEMTSVDRESGTIHPVESVAALMERRLERALAESLAAPFSSARENS